MNWTSHKATDALLTRMISISILAIVIAAFGYGFYCVVSAQNSVDGSGDENPQLFNGRIIFQRGSVSKPFYGGATLYTINPFSGTETSFGTGSEPSYSNDGTKVAFIKTGQLFFGSASDYSTAKGLVVPGGGSAEIGLYPKISPDNTQILYQSTTSVGGTLLYHTYIINAACILDNNQYRDTSVCNVTELNPGGTNAFIFPAWMPVEGTSGSNRLARIAYVRTSSNKDDVDGDKYTGQIFIEDLTIAANGTVTEGQKTQLTITAAKYAFLSYDPSGLRIYLENGGIYWLSADNGGNPRPVVTTGSTDPISGHHPVISPDGSKVAFDDGFSLVTADLSMTPDGSTFANNMTQVPVTSANFDLFPSWQGVATPLATPTPTPTPSTQTALTLTSANYSPNPAYAKENLTYSATVTNNGPNDGSFAVSINSGWPAVTLPTGCTDNQAFPGNYTCTGSVANGKSTTIQLVVRPTTPVTGHSVQVQLQNFNGTVTGSPINLSENILPAQTDLGVTATGPTSSVLAGAKITEHITVTNYGPSQASAPFVGIDFPSGGLSFSTADQSGNNCNNLISGHALTCSLSAMDVSPAAGGTFAFDLVLRGTQAGTFGTAISVSNTDPDPSPDPHANSTNVSTTVTAATDLAITATSAPNPVLPDAPLTYTLTVTNNGPASTTNVLINTSIPGDSYLVTSATSSDCASVKDAQGNNTRNIQCKISSLASKAQSTELIVVRPKGNVTPVTFTASVSSSLPDPTLANNDVGDVNTQVGSTVHPANDNFLNATQLSGTSGTITDSNVGATYELPIYYTADHTIKADLEGPHCCAGNIVYGGKSVWYKWNAPSGTTGTLYVDTLGSKVDASATAPPFDSILAVYAQDNSSHVTAKIASSDDVAPPSDPTSGVNFNYDSLHTYYIVVDGKNGATSSQFKLNWRAAQATGSSGFVVNQNITVGFFPSNNCTSTSNAPDICKPPIDNSGRIVLDIRGQNFTPNSTVVVDGKNVLGWTGTDLNGNPVNGIVSYLGSDHLQAGIPANPPLSKVGPLFVQVLTKMDSSGPIAQVLGAANSLPESICSVLDPACTNLPDGTYGVAFGSRVGNVVEVQQATVQPGETKKICGNEKRSDTGDVFGLCVTFTNTSTQPATVPLSFFTSLGNCFADARTDDEFNQCVEQAQNNSGSVAFNVLNGQKFDITVPFDLPPGATSAVTVQLAVSAGSSTPPAVNSLPVTISNSGGTLIGNNGSTLIGNNGSTIVAQGGGNIVAQGGGNLVNTNGSNIVAQGGGNLLSSDGAGLIGNNGSTLTTVGGHVVGSNGSGIAQPGGADSLSENKHRNSTSINSMGDAAGVRLYSASTLANGIGGMIIGAGSGGAQPTYTTTTDPVTGETHGTISFTLDNTSFPTTADLRGLAFTVLVNPTVIKVGTTSVTVDKTAGRATVTLQRAGDTSGPARVDFATQNDTANARSDYSPVFGSVTFAAGETSKDITIPLINNGYGSTAFGASRKFELVIGNAIGGAIEVPNFATVTITNNQPANSTTNPLDASDARFFVRQQYLDFLSREPDQGGWDFWSNNITGCAPKPSCTDIQRINTSAAYFLSIEFQQTGYLVERLYKTAYGSGSGTSTFGGTHQIAVPIVRFNEFLPDTQQIGSGVVVGATGWETVLENNKQAFAAEFTQRSRFTTAFPASSTAAQFVDTLNANAGNVLSPTDRNQLVSDLSSGAKTRAQVLRTIAENQNLSTAEFNRAFVLMQFFGYLRRDPNSGQDTDYTGLDFWLTKLNAFNGNFQNAEMVKAFITSTEYRQRFGP
jgi:uncharacterized repeat protein (TIGR01451 family)